MKEYEKIYQNFIGKDKIQPLKITNNEDGSFSLHYKEGKKNDSIECADRSTLEKILIEFGGKNPETCRAPDYLLKFNSAWTYEDILLMGHKISKISLRGRRETRNDFFPIILPDNCGSPTLSKKKPTKEAPSEIRIGLKDKEEASITWQFNNQDEFDVFQAFFSSHESLKKLHWDVVNLVTENKKTKVSYFWKRVKAGDGTKRMVLELIGLNGEHYTDCVRQDLFNAADDMFYAPCQRVKVKNKAVSTRELCMLAVEDGKVSVEGLEAAR